MDKHIELMSNKYGLTSAPLATQLFGNAGKEHMEKYGTPNVCDKYLHSKRTS